MLVINFNKTDGSDINTNKMRDLSIKELML